MEQLSSEEAKELLNNRLFKKAVSLLTQHIRQIDTVRGIDLSAPIQDTGMKAVAAKLSIDIIEGWLSEIVGTIELKDYTPSDDDIFRIIETETKY